MVDAAPHLCWNFSPLSNFPAICSLSWNGQFSSSVKMLRRTMYLACNTKHVGRLYKISLMPFYGQRWKICAFISFLFVFAVKMKALAFATFAEVWHESKIKKPCTHFTKAHWVNVWLAETALHFKVIVHYKAPLSTFELPGANGYLPSREKA